MFTITFSHYSIDGNCSIESGIPSLVGEYSYKNQDKKDGPSAYSETDSRFRAFDFPPLKCKRFQ